jgi:hypothetical protein
VKKLIILTLAAFAALPLAAQTVTPPKPLDKKGPTPQPALRPPESLKPGKLARMNTAERGEAFNPQPPPTHLPDLILTDDRGMSTPAAGIAHKGHWLLLYRRDSCLPCDRLMNVLAASKSTDLQGGVPFVILVEGKANNAAEQVRPNFKSMSKASWLTDSKQQVRTQLKVHGAPMLYAMDGTRIEWAVAGNLGNPEKVERIAASWVASDNADNMVATAARK